MDVADSFQRGRGLRVRLFGIIPIAGSIGPRFDAGEGMRGLAEMPFHPLGFCDSRFLAWEAFPAGDPRRTFEAGDRRLAVDFEIGEEGASAEFVLSGRELSGRAFVDTPWSGRFADYVMIDGVRVPSWVEVTWHLPDGPYTWFRARIEGFRTVA